MTLAILASRTALRVLPLGVMELSKRANPDDLGRRASVAMFRANLFARLAIQYTGSGNGHSSVHAAAEAADAANEAMACAPVFAAARAAEAATYVLTGRNLGKSAAGGAIEYVTVRAAHAAEILVAPLEHREFWDAIEADCTLHEGGQITNAELLSQKLWLTPRPRWFEDALGISYRIWLEERERWSVWNIWYDRRLEGQPNEWPLPPPEDAEMLNRTLGSKETIWTVGEQNPAYLNQKIAEWIAELTPELPPSLGLPEEQNDFGLRFRQTEGGSFELDESAGGDEVLVSAEACDRHAELLETLNEAAARCRNHNRTSELVPLLEKAADMLGNHPREIKIGRFMQKTERCLSQAEALAQGMKDGGPLASLPESTQQIVVLLDALPKAYWAMVNFDPALVRRVPMMQDPSVPLAPSITFRDINLFLNESIEEKLITPAASAAVLEMSEGLDDPATTDARRERRFWETVRNHSRAVLAVLWHHKKKVLSTTAIAATWLVAKQGILLALFAGNPAMIEIINTLADWAAIFSK
jgi:hypothetical protein